MSSILLGAIVFACLFGTALGAMALRNWLPETHLSSESRDTIKLATAIVGTLAALALGLLIASAKSAFDQADNELRSSVALVVLLDRSMAHYGPETAEARELVKGLVKALLARPWGETGEDRAAESRVIHDRGIEPVQDILRNLKPDNDAQRWLQQRALTISGEIAESRWMLVESTPEWLPTPFFIIMVFWLALLFGSFGLLAPVPGNATVVVTLMACALSVAGAVFLVVDMAHPYRGLIYISDQPLRSALDELGR